MASSGWMCGMSKTCLVTATIFGSLAGAHAVAAQEPQASPTPAIEEAAAPTAETPPSAAGDRVVSTAPDPQLHPSSLPVAEGAIQLSLDDAVTVALQRNLNLLVQRFGREQFRLGIAEQLGIYDVGLNVNAFSTSETSPSRSLTSGVLTVSDKQRNGNVSVAQLTPWGGVGTMTFNLFRGESTSKDVPVNPIYSGNVNLSVTQPLLRNFGLRWTERNIRIARINHDANREDFELQVTSTLQQVENAYWNLVQARKEVEVAKESLRLAEDLHRMNKVRVDVGTLAPLELVQSEVGIATRQETIILAQATEQAAEDELRRLLHLEEGELWTLPIVPTTAAESPPIEIDLAQAISTALKERPDLRGQQLVLDRRALDVALARNQLRPALDLTARYGYSGGNTIVIIDPATGLPTGVRAGGVSDVVDQLRDRNLPSWRLELNLAFPLQNRSARAAKAIADVNLERGETEMEQLQEAVRTEVRQAVRSVRTALQTIESAGASVRLAEQNLDAERKRYENGLSTSFQVLQIQEDLTAARSRQVTAVASYRRALAEYHRATGRLLEAEGVELEDPLRVDHLSRFGWGIGGPGK